MHQLTIDHDARSVSVTEHPNYDEAHRALLDYVVGADYYLRPVQNRAAHTTYELLRLADADQRGPNRGPRITGTATIAEHREEELPVSGPYFSACEAQSWIDEHGVKWRHGSDTDPGHRYPMAVLTTAHGEAHFLLRAGTLLPEAARLAGAESASLPDQDTLEMLRHNAIALAGCGHPHSPAALAAEVQRHLPADITAHQRAALIWWTALLIWGARTP
jgi:hypothetical protein